MRKRAGAPLALLVHPHIRRNSARGPKAIAISYFATETHARDDMVGER